MLKPPLRPRTPVVRAVFFYKNRVDRQDAKLLYSLQRPEERSGFA